MPQARRKTQVCILGGGTAGSAVARFAAEAGLDVVCLDQQARDRAGAHWVNGIPNWTWDAVGLDKPLDPELRGNSQRFHLVAGMDGPRISVEGHQSQEVDMRLLARRLRAGAESAGAEFLFDTTVNHVSDGVVDCGDLQIESEFVVDASGLGGKNLLGSERVGKRDICAAAQEVRTCDPEAGLDFFEKNGAREHEALCFSGIAGGFSILNVHLNHDHLNILTGSVPGDGHPSGRKMLDDFVASHDWIGERQFGGSAAIPIRRPFDTLAMGRVAAVGDAACQVFPAHGSGITPQLLAAKILATNISNGDGVRGYEREYQRTWGGLSASYDVFRTFSQQLSLEDLAGLMEAGIMTPETSRTAIEQRLPDVPTPSQLKDYARGLSQQPALAARLLKIAAAMLAVRQLYRFYPEAGSLRQMWSRSVARLVG
jgi:flavin-dependent dehydrogenase